ncbi:MAG: inositol 2-dehydrogenase [Spirochaetaceae bacterium]|nr:MAG: inositol 2-dehydrogenase [Spirochaetaceae bacterium]
MIRFGVLGAGFIGSVHAGNIAANPRARLISVFDIDEKKAGLIAEKHGARVGTSAEQLLGESEIDAVVIASSTPTHVSYLKAAAEAGKAILCEKPISLDYEEAREAHGIVEHSAVPVMVGFNRRFDRNYSALKDTIETGTIGKVEIIQVTHRGPQLPSLEYLKVSGGQFRDSGVHFYDLVRWLTNEDPAEVFAFGSCLVDPSIAEFGDTDTSIISLRFDSGALCQINFSRRTAYGYEDRIEVFGSEGMVESQRQRRGEVAIYKGDRITVDGLHRGWFERTKATYGLEIDALIEALEKREMPSPSLTDGLKAQAVAEAATESYKTSRPVLVSY